MNIKDLKFSEVKELIFQVEEFKCEMYKGVSTPTPLSVANINTHPMLNRRCIIRTYSAGVHIGDVVFDWD